MFASSLLTPAALLSPLPPLLLQGYCLVLVDCDVSLVGLVLLFLLAALFTCQPTRGRWEEPGTAGAAATEGVPQHCASLGSGVLPFVMQGLARSSGASRAHVPTVLHALEPHE